MHVDDAELLPMQGWNDYHLAWNESDYANVKSIRIPAELLWKPDILMYNRSYDKQ